MNELTREEQVQVRGELMEAFYHLLENVPAGWTEARYNRAVNVLDRQVTEVTNILYPE